MVILHWNFVLIKLFPHIKYEKHKLCMFCYQQHSQKTHIITYYLETR